MFTSFATAPCTQDDETIDLFQSIIQHTGAIKVQKAKAVCSSCPVETKRACLELGTYDGDALDGVYGGLSQKERATR